MHFFKKTCLLTLLQSAMFKSDIKKVLLKKVMKAYAL